MSINKLSALGILVLALALVISHFLAPFPVSSGLSLGNLLTWGAPAVFYEGLGQQGMMPAQVEPWHLLGLQLPAFASIELSDSVPDSEPVFPVFPTPGQTEPQPRSGSGLVAIYHTHTTEAFVPTTGSARTKDFSETVVRLGQIIDAELAGLGIEVIQSNEFHDEEYRYSYTRSYKTAEQMVRDNPNLDLLLDIHRDGVGNTSQAGRPITTARVNGVDAGRIMFVIGARHDTWRKNYEVAQKLHNILEANYPGLSRGILIRNLGTYNQELHPQAVLVEIGGHWNTLEEAEYGARLFARAVAIYLGSEKSD